MSNLDIFNLDAEAFVTKTAQQGGGKDLEFYKPYPEDGKDGVYKSLIRFVPNPVDPAKSKVHKYYVYLNDPVSGDGFSVDCPSTVGKKSILKDLFWKLKNSHSAADQELAKKFSRKEDFYALIQIVQDKNSPELEGKIGGCGIRVPVPDGSLTDITFNVKRQVSIEEINQAFKKAAETNFKGILDYTEDPIVSVDIIGNQNSCLFDSQLTSVIDKMVKIVGWYDNETGYSSRLIDLITFISKK
jgi:hypothetical protein